MASQRTLDLLAKKAKKEKEAVKNKTEKTVEEIIVKKEEIKEQKIIQQEIKIKKEPVVWDVKIGDSIEYFDPDLSYELTGYRPIDENRGLDFDPLPFSENAKIYETTGYYTTYVKGFKLYDDFWREQVRRCKDGYTVNDYTITGDHYFFLNFYRIKSPVKGAGSTDGSNFGETFPTFCVEQYKWFHYLSLCEKLNLDANALKPRAVDKLAASTSNSR